MNAERDLIVKAARALVALEEARKDFAAGQITADEYNRLANDALAVPPASPPTPKP